MPPEGARHWPTWQWIVTGILLSEGALAVEAVRELRNWTDNPNKSNGSEIGWALFGMAASAVLALAVGVVLGIALFWIGTAVISLLREGRRLQDSDDDPSGP